MKRRGIFVGPQHYHMLGDLKYTRDDARATSQAFQKFCGFEPGSITLMTCQAEGGLNAHSTYIEQALDNLRLEQREQTQPLELLVFGFWGHGFAPQPGQRYLCGVETMESNLAATAVSLELVQAKLKQIPAKNTLILLDCCQNRPAGRSTAADPMTTGERSAQDSMARDIQAARAKQFPSLEPTVAILSACSEGEKAYEWDERRHGVFTAHFLDGLRRGKTGIAELAQFTRQQVNLTTRNLYHQPQTPRLKLEGGDIRLVTSTAKPAVSNPRSSRSKLAPGKSKPANNPPPQSPQTEANKTKTDLQSIPVLAAPAQAVVDARAQQQQAMASYQRFRQQVANNASFSAVEEALRKKPALTATELLEHKPDSLSRSDFTKCVALFASVVRLELTCQQAQKTFAAHQSKYILEFLRQKGCLGKQAPFPEQHLLKLVPRLARYSATSEEIIWNLAETSFNDYWSAQQKTAERRTARWKAAVTIAIVFAIIACTVFAAVWYATQDARQLASFFETIESSANANAADRATITIDGVQYAFRWCPPGEFTMGSSSAQARSDEKLLHQVMLTKGFWMLETEVTQEMYESIMGSDENDSQFFGSRHPVDSVDWKEASEFSRKLTAQLGAAVRLPTEAEWEYACRAGTSTKFYWGDDDSEQVIKAYCWYEKNADSGYWTYPRAPVKGTQPVAMKKPNEWGLHDMSGNVWELCQDTWHVNYQGAPTDGSAWEDKSSASRVCRGGSWEHIGIGWGGSPYNLRSAYRNHFDPDNQYISLGFRVVLPSIPNSSQAE